MNADRVGQHAFRLVVRGELGDQFGSLFDGMHLVRESGTTVLTGEVRDQAHLAGLLDRALDLGLEIVSFAQVDEDASS